jgi:membrane protease YdiL (CAAX protease family)
VLATVVLTSAAGVILCYGRQRSDSLLAPLLLHWAVNIGGVLFVLVG